jgi:hypothetical protein
MIGTRRLTLTVLLLATAGVGRAATFPVVAGDVAGLVSAINMANGNGQDDTITLAAGSTYSLTAADNPMNGLPVITSKITIQGNDATIQRTGAPEFRLFDVSGTGDLTLDHLTVKGGQVTFNAPIVQFNDGGGGIRVNGAGKLTLTSSTVTQNTCNGNVCQGGGVLLFDPSQPLATLIDSTVSQNFAQTGGGISLRHNSQNLVLTRTLVSGNTGESGGGIATNGHDVVTITDSTISGNSVSELVPGGALGGGVLDIGGGTWTITGSTFTGNSASGHNTSANATNIYGGAMGENGGATITMLNTTIVGNSLTNTAAGLVSGAGLFGEGGGTWTLRNVTVAGNTVNGGTGATGGGVAATSGFYVLVNSIVANNTAPSRPDCDTAGNQFSSVTSLGHSLLEDTTGCGFTSGPGDITGQDPKLDALAGNGGPTKTAALLPGSPAIDKGDPAAPGTTTTACEATDQRAVARPQGPACDIGAFEVGVTTTTTLPGCGVRAPTFASIDCRLDLLIAQVQAAQDLGKLKKSLLASLTQARDRKRAAEGITKRKLAVKRVKQAMRKMIDFNFRVRSLTGRKTIPGPTRKSLMDQGVPIQKDLQTLAKML